MIISWPSFHFLHQDWQKFGIQLGGVKKVEFRLTFEGSRASNFTMFQRLTSFLPFRGSQETSADDGADEAGYESTGSDGTYADCVSDDEQKQISSDGLEDAKKSPHSSATHHFVDPPVSSRAVAAEATLASGLVEDGSFSELDPADDFVQTSPLLKTSESQKNWAPPKGKLFVLILEKCLEIGVLLGFFV